MLSYRGNVLVTKSHVKHLMDAGLTNLQARVFLGILSLGEGTVSTISKFTEIDRSNVYKTIKDLAKMELIEKYVGTKTKYKPIPLQMTISILSNRKKQEYRTLLDGLQELAKDFDPLDNYKKKKESDYFKILPAGTESFSRNWEITLKNVKRSVDLIITEHREIKDEPIWNIYDELLYKGVNVRWLFDRSTKNDQEFILRVKQFEHLLKYSNLELKICFDCLKPYFGIIDNDFVVVFLDEGTHLKCVRTLWTNNRQMLLNFKEHFETHWNNAIPYQVKSKL